MMKHLRTATLMTVVTTVLLGLVYPLVVTGLAQVLFPDQANGQLIERDGRVIGSRIIGQPFTSPGYFYSRPSAAGAGLRRRRVVRVESRTDQQEADRSRGRRRGAAARRQSGRARPDRSGDHVGLRTRPAHQPGRGPLSGAACGARARPVGGRRARSWWRHTPKGGSSGCSASPW